MNKPWSWLAMVVLLAGCSSDEHGADSGTADAGPTVMDGGAAMHDASPAHSITPGKSDGGRVILDGGAVMHDTSSQQPSDSPDESEAGSSTDAGSSSCPFMSGIYQPVYTPVDGTCGAITNPLAVVFDGGLHGVNTIMQVFANSVVTTDIVIKGCSVHMEQSVSDRMGTPQTDISGSSLTIKSPTVITGRITFQRFNPNSQVVCTGTYDAVFSKRAMSNAAH